MWKGSSLQGAVALAWVWHKKCSKAPQAPALAPSSPSSSLSWWVPPPRAQQHNSWKASAVLFRSFKAVMVSHEKEEAGQRNYAKATFKKPVSSSNKVGFFAVVAVSSEDRSWYEPCLFIKAGGPGEEEREFVSGEPFQTCRFPGHNW